MSTTAAADAAVLDRFSDPVRTWFTTTFGTPTPPQSGGWGPIADGDHTLICAPTGSGKTLAAFLWGIDRLVAEPRPEAGTRVLYISPLRALAVDIDKNLRGPLTGIALAAERTGTPVTVPTVGIRTGDTPADERRRLKRHPPDVLITTPESLYLMLTSQARETLAHVEHVIIDEIHAVAATKRGAHLALTLERLAEVCEKPPQRIGLSATQRPLSEIARFLGGRDDDGRWRPVTIVDEGSAKQLEVEIVVPIEDMASLGTFVEEPTSGPAAAGPVRRSIWPSMHPMLLELIESHRSTLVFVNSRRLAERLATRLNELALDGESRGGESDGTSPQGPPLVKAHHGSLSRPQRLLIEDELKRGELKALVATSSLELGIDMGAVDLVVQVESPGAVSRGMQRIGRAGHQVGAPSRGKIFPKHRADLLEAAVVVERMLDGRIEHTRYLRNPLDVLAQQMVAMCAMDDWPVADMMRVVRRSASFAELTDDVFRNVVEMLAGRYPSESFSELRPRIVWDRVADVLRGRSGAQRLAVTNAGTIPDRGLFGVFLPDGTRVGELDEEMVYESRPGETFLLGASTWRIEDISYERVVVTPAPGEPGRMPFWHGDGPGRPFELGRALGEFTRELRERPDAIEHLRESVGLDDRAAVNLVQYLSDQAEATGVVPDDRTIVVERFRDEIGDWRVCIHSPFGAQVHAPGGVALRARLADEWGVDVEMMWSDDGIVVRLPEAVDDMPVDELLIDPDELTELLVTHLPSTALFAARFRECAGRALLLPRRRPDQRTPLWQQRQRAADLLRAAAPHPDFPILLETTRECLDDVFDVPALRQLLRDLRSRAVRVVSVETAKASPFAQSLLFGWIAVYMYEGDAPLAERRAAALALDRDLLAELLGSEELRELIDGDVLAALEAELQRLVEGRRARDGDEVHDLVRVLGPLTVEELTARCVDDLDVAATVSDLIEQRRLIEVAIADEPRVAAAEDAARLRDALGVALPVGLPAVFTEPVLRPLEDLVARHARTHGPFTTADVARRLAVSVERAAEALEAIESDGRLVRGEFRPDGHEREWCDGDVLRSLRRRSLAALRREVEPTDAAAYARFAPLWQGVGGRRRGIDAVVEALTTLSGAALPASVFEDDILAARVAGYQRSDLDALCTSGEVVWVGAGPIGATDGRLRLVFRDQAPLLVPPSGDDAPEGPVHDAIRGHLEGRGASFWADLLAAVAAAGAGYGEEEVLAALWDLVWSGEVTNDSLAPVRTFVAARSKRAAPARKGRPRPGRLRATGPPAAAGRWSLVAPLLEPRPTATEIAHARASQLLERYGVLTREAALAEGAQGGFAGVYPVLKALEEQGKVRRGYFVEGLGAAQFALPGAVERLRSQRRDATGVPDRPADPPTPGMWDEADADGDPAATADAAVTVLAATDTAQPYGAALDWPETQGRPARSAGSQVVLVDGEPAVLLERGARSLVTFPASAGDDRWAAALAQLVDRGRIRRIEIAKVDGETLTAESAVAPALEAAGFVRSYRGWAYARRSRARG
ncbi:MAG: DEAD/DEAH box helicase [Acidimicrobiales bacterium]